MARVQALSPDQQTIAAKPLHSDVTAPAGREAIDFADFFENAAVALHVVGPDGTIMHANTAELELLGYAPESYIGRNIADVHADREVIDDILARLGRGETLNKYPARLLARDGSVRHVEITSNVQFCDGEFVGTRCITVDNTELVLAREDVRRKDEQLRDILDALPAAIYTTDASGTINYANRAAAELAGKQPELGKDKWCVTFRMLTPNGEELPHDACPMAVALKENRAVRGAEALAQRPDGTVFPFLPFPTPLRDAEGGLVGAVNMLVDISERKRAEEELRRSREFKRRILESTQDCIRVLDLDGCIRSINDCGYRALGLESASAIEGARYLDLWHDEDRAAAKAALQDSLGGGTGRFTARYTAPSGAISWWDEAITPMLGPGGTPEKLLVVSRDVTEIKAANEQREILIAELNHRVKNSLATVQSLARATLPTSPAFETYFGRLRALAEAHRLLADTRWDGGCLETIVKTIVKPYSERARVSGGGVRLTPRAAQTMCMVINELATNAAKYGALSKAGGHVDVSWSLAQASDGAELTISWVEVGGPVVAEPTRRGFGTSLIVQAVEYELKGRTELSFAPEGLRCRIALPWNGNVRRAKTPECP